MNNRTGFSRALHPFLSVSKTNVGAAAGGASHDCLSGHVSDNQRSCEREGSIYEIPDDSCSRGRSSGLVAVRLRPRVAALRDRGRLLSRSRRGGDPLRSRRRVCSPAKPAWRPSVQQRRVWRSYPRRPQGMLPVLLKHFPDRTLVRPKWTPVGARKSDQQGNRERFPIPLDRKALWLLSSAKAAIANFWATAPTETIFISRWVCA